MPNLLLNWLKNWIMKFFFLIYDNAPIHKGIKTDNLKHVMVNIPLYSPFSQSNWVCLFQI